ncbi:MAG: inorganic diphosphatase [Bacteroidota bacterium]|nr:inorganic diphosphatase [Bacteroidota bacterium]
MKTVTAIIESPKGCGYKYDYEPELKQFKVSKILPAGLVFPFDFGFIPGTKGEDGDPLDVVVISEMTSFPGCAIDCRIIGALKAEQTERDGKSMRNDRFLAIPDISGQFGSVNEAHQLPEGILKQVEVFFKNYNRQAGKKFKVLDRLNSIQAARLIK